MKQFIIVLFFIVQSHSSFSQSQDPYIWSGDCSIGISRYLSRSINMEYLVLRHPDVQRVLPPPNNAGGYNENINMLADLNATLIVRSSTVWFNEALFNRERAATPNLPARQEGILHRANRELVRDINNAYDTHTPVRHRPIIQAGIFESAEIGIDQVEIPQYVINAFFSPETNEPRTIEPANISQLDRNRYLNGTTARIGLMFSRDRTRNGRGLYDIRNLETQMWMFYQAREHLDAGYTSLHMGVYNDYARNNLIDLVPDPNIGFNVLRSLLEKIRFHARLRPRIPFVLICGENPSGNSTTDTNGNLLFDFDSRAMRIREFTNTGDGVGCNSQVNQNMFGTACGYLVGEGIAGFVDPCVINNFGGSRGGTLPLGCFVSQIPYIVHFDFGTQGNVDRNNGSDGPDSPCYGASDTRYFTNLSPACRREWWRQFYCERRDYHEGNGFIVAPGLIIDQPTLNSNFPNFEFSMRNDPNFLTTVVNTWSPNASAKNEGDISITLSRGSIVSCCGNRTARESHTYTIRVTNPSCGSYYTIHMKDPNGNWLPFTRGNTRTFQPNMNGEYKIIVREDNLGFVATNGGYIWLGEGTNEKEFTRSFTTSGCYYNPYNYYCRNSQKSDENDLEAFKIYPNPASTKINVTIFSEQEDKVNVKIYNSLGSVMQEIEKEISLGDNKFDLDIQNLAHGIYFVSINGKDGINKQKFIKQ